MQRYRQGFTLIEIMVVVIILGVLTGLIVPQLFKHVGKSRHMVAAQKITQIESAIQLFATEYERLPETIEELIIRPSDIDEQLWLTPTVKQKNLLDPWKRPFVYIYPGDQNPDSFDLLSLGKDGQQGGTGENKDVTNW